MIEFEEEEEAKKKKKRDIDVWFYFMLRVSGTTSQVFEHGDQWRC